MLDLYRLMRLFAERPRGVEENTSVAPPAARMDDRFAEDPEENRIRALFSEQPASLEALRKHIEAAPTRGQFNPKLLDRALAILAGIGAGGDRPERGIPVAMEMLDRPYKRAVEEHTRVGKQLEDMASLDERHLSNRRQGEQAVEQYKTRRDVAKGSQEQRAAELEERIRANKVREEDRDLDREARAEAARERAALMRELAELRRSGSDSEKKKKLDKYFDPESGENVVASQEEAELKGYQPKLGDKEVNRERFLRNSKRELEGALEFFKKNPGKTGQVQGRFTGIKRALDMEDPETLKNMNILESYRGDSLNLKAGSALTPTELKVFDVVNPKVTQSDEHLVANLEEVVRRLGEMTRKSGTVKAGGTPTEIEVPGVGKVRRTN